MAAPRTSARGAACGAVGLSSLRPAQTTRTGRIARRLREAEMPERCAGEQPPARGALDEALLDQKRLDDVLDGVARLRQAAAIVSTPTGPPP